MKHCYLIVFLSFIFFIMLTPAHAARLALVIGNGEYNYLPALSHPVNDAKEMAIVLKKLGFTVILKLNLNKKMMQNAVRDFAQRLHNDDIALFYFSGYGVQSDQRNYLIPRWASIQNKTDIESEALEVNAISRQIEDNKLRGITIIILEASRTNPYKNIKNLEEGLAKISPRIDTLIAYSAAPNQVSYTKHKGSYSLYTQYLLNALHKKAFMTIPDLLTRVAKQVKTETKDQQEPWYSSTLKQSFCFDNCEKQSSYIAQSLRECEVHFKANRLTSGKGTTALACYQALLEIDNNNADALAGLKQIETRYIEWIKQALNKKQKSKAKQYLARLHQVNPNAPTTLDELEEWLKSPPPPASPPQKELSPQKTVLQVKTIPPPPPICNSAGQTFQDRLQEGRLGPKMVCIPAGQFQIGDIQGSGYSNEQPVHEVSINAFAMGRYEITFAEYDDFVQITGQRKPKDKGWGRDNRPVIWVSWQDAVAYTEWLTEQTGRHYRLPTEAEWEYAARAGTKTEYWWGNEIGSNQCVCADSGSSWSDEQTAPVGSFAPNPFGLYDTVGNVWEWTCSSYESGYSGAEQHCVDKKIQGERQLRGGSWFFNPKLCRVAMRNRSLPDKRYNNVGFRVVVVFQ